MVGESLAGHPLYFLRQLVEERGLVMQGPEVGFCQGWWQPLSQREPAGGGLPAGVPRAALAYGAGSFPPLVPRLKISSAVCHFAIMSPVWIRALSFCD